MVATLEPSGPRMTAPAFTPFCDHVVRPQHAPPLADTTTLLRTLEEVDATIWRAARARLGRRGTEADVEDVVQEARARMLLVWPGAHCPTIRHVHALAHKIATNLAGTLLRTRQRQARLLASVTAAYPHWPTRESIGLQERRMLWRALRVLTRLQRRAFVMIYLRRFEMEQAAAQLGKSYEQLASLLARARARVREELTGE